MYHVLLDTDIFKAENLHFDSRRFRRLAEFVNAQQVYVCLTDVTVGEIERAIISAVADAVGLLKQKELRRILGVLVQTDTAHLSGVLKLDKEAVTRDLIARFHRLLSDLKVVTVASDGVSIAEVRKRYFEARPPFSEKRAQKCEFPDAISVLAAEEHARALGSTIYVVSGDDGIRDAVEIAPNLSYFDSLASVTSHILESLETTAAITMAAEKAAAALNDAIVAKVRDEFTNSGFYVDDEWYGDVDEVIVQDIGLSELTVAEIDGARVTLEFLAAIQFTADVVIDDPERSGYGYIEQSVHATIDDIEGTIELDIDTSNPARSKILSVSLVPGDFGVKFPWPGQ